MTAPGRKPLLPADLVLAVLICGLVAALLQLPTGSDLAALLMIAVGVFSSSVWFYFQSYLTGNQCTRCGQRYTALKSPSPILVCPNCGAYQLRLARHLARWQTPARAPMVILGGLVACVVLGFVTHGMQPSPRFPFSILIFAAAFFATIVAEFPVNRQRVRLTRAPDRLCEARFHPLIVRPLEPGACPKCLNLAFPSPNPSRARISETHKITYIH